MIVSIDNAKARLTLSQLVFAVDERATLGSVVNKSQIRLKRVISELSTYNEMSIKITYQLPRLDWFHSIDDEHITS